MSVHVAETFELLFDKNNTAAYKALQELQKESENTNSVYLYMDRLSDMLDSDNSYICTRGLVLLALFALHNADTSVYDDSMQPLVYKDIQKALKEIEKL
ncbi:hypothetical protein VV089_09245 [Candidatus Merdisoma sp. JLR.KK011]|uniref:hypothetical protein n=1 Tax=Candidatus Merdisoma sp. JLR.KK011 TaxID=3114299 RepID=UPI002FF08207